jgi:hypothetical protein
VIARLAQLTVFAGAAATIDEFFAGIAPFIGTNCFDDECVYSVSQDTQTILLALPFAPISGVPAHVAAGQHSLSIVHPCSIFSPSMLLTLFIFFLDLSNSFFISSKEVGPVPNDVFELLFDFDSGDGWPTSASSYRLASTAFTFSWNEVVVVVVVVARGAAFLGIS